MIGRRLDNAVPKGGQSAYSVGQQNCTSHLKCTLHQLPCTYTIVSESISYVCAVDSTLQQNNPQHPVLNKGYFKMDVSLFILHEKKE